MTADTPSFTLIIPTFNRSEHLARLLAYLGRCRIDFSVVVLDSSRQDEARKNARAAQSCNFPVTLHTYAPEIPLKEKLLDGLTKIDSEFCAFCADDDLVLPQAIDVAVRFLKNEPDYVSAHGLYFAFTLGSRRCFVDDVLYDAPSLDKDSGIERVVALFFDYQSNFYAVYRSAVQRRVFEVAVSQDNSLFFELMQSALPAAMGKVARLPIVYAGRQRSPSVDNPTRWHPVEWLAADPVEYGAAFNRFREPLLDILVENNASNSAEYNREDLKKIIDLMHLRYSAYSIKEPGIDAALRAHMKHKPRQEIVEEAFAAAYAPEALLGLRPESTLYKVARGGYRRFLRPIMGYSIKRRLGLRRGASRQQISGVFVDLELNAPAIEKLAAFRPGLERSGVETIQSAIENYAAATEVGREDEHSAVKDSLGKPAPSGFGPASEKVIAKGAGSGQPASLSIIIPNFNHQKYLTDAVTAACEQTRRVDEVIVVDDGSTDDSVRIVKGLLEIFPNLRLIESEQNEGPNQATKKGVDSTSSQYIAVIAADDFLRPDFAEKSMAALERHPEAGLCFSNYAVLNDETNEITEHAYRPQMLGIFNNRKYPEHLSPNRFRKHLETGVIWMSGNTVIFKRDAFAEAGGFIEEAKWHSDWLVCQIIALRHGACVVPETLAVIRSVSGSYSSGRHDPVQQRKTIRDTIEIIRQRGYSDIYRAFLRYPIIISPLGDEVIAALRVRPRFWPLLSRYWVTCQQLRSGYGSSRRRRLLYWPLTSVGKRWDPDYAPPLKRLEKPTFGIILTNYNDARYLRTSLGAMVRQTRPLDEILIVDDGSTDDSVATIKEFQEENPNIRLLRNEQNMGVNYSINRALAESKCDFVNWAASDDMILPEFVEKSAGVLERHPDAVICMSELATFSHEEYGLEPKRGDADVFDLSVAPECMSPEQVSVWLSSHILWVSGNTTFIRRQSLLAMGGYLPQFEWHSDWFVGMVLSARYGVCVVPEVLAGLRRKEGSYSDQGLKDQARQDNVIRAIVAAIKHPNYRDILSTVRKHPVLLSPLGDYNVIRALMFRPQHWHLLTLFVFWRITYNARHAGVGNTRIVVRFLIRRGSDILSVVSLRVDPWLNRLLGIRSLRRWAAILAVQIVNPFVRGLHTVVFFSSHAEHYGLSKKRYLKTVALPKLWQQFIKTGTEKVGRP